MYCFRATQALLCLNCVQCKLDRKKEEKAGVIERKVPEKEVNQFILDQKF
jgi:hypothetical protein